MDGGEGVTPFRPLNFVRVSKSDVCLNSDGKSPINGLKRSQREQAKAKVLFQVVKNTKKLSVAVKILMHQCLQMSKNSNTFPSITM